MVNFNPKRILCPVDFSDHSAAALRIAGGVARAFGAEVIVRHARFYACPNRGLAQATEHVLYAQDITALYVVK